MGLTIVFAPENFPARSMAAMGEFEIAWRIETGDRKIRA
jgi:hypothetical protein